ncbi:MAG: hypothetical protein MJ151_03115 [Lachnospiraceae bacterium]|nr:hypothetical protein [Lachnospiraceae bacterium]
MMKKWTKNKNNLLIDMTFLLYFICSISVCSYAAAVKGPGATIQSTTVVTTEPETTHPKGFKLEGAEFYDYVGYDDQGRLVDKSNIIIGKGSGGSGQGGGSSSSGSRGADSSGTGGSGTSGYAAGQAPGQGGSGANIGGNGNSGNSRNIIGANGNQSSNTALKKQQAAEEASRQASIEAELSTAGARKNEVLESIRQKALQESREKESIRQSSMKAEALAKARAQNPTSSKGQVVEKKVVVETETVTYKTDEVTRAPVNHTQNVTKENQITERVTQPKPVFDDTVPTVVVPEIAEETTVNTPDKNLPEVPLNVPVVTNGPENMIEETTVVESEVVTVEETTVKTTTVKQTEEAKKQEAAKEDKKKGDKGEIEHDDEDADYKEELGYNKEDGKGDGKGGAFNGVKIFEIERKGNLGVTEKAGINNLEKMIAGIVVSLLLLIGILSYYVPYIFKPKNKKSNFIS